MLDSILQFLGLVTKTFKREDVIKTIDNTSAVISDSVIPMLHQLADSDSVVIKKDKTLEEIRKGCKLKAKDNKEVILEMIKRFENLQAGMESFRVTANKFLSSVMTEKTITARQGVILRAVQDINGMSLFTLDLIILIILNKAETNLPKKRVQDINENVFTFISIFRTYTEDFKKFVADIAKVSDDVVDPSVNSELMNMHFAKSGYTMHLPMEKGFVGNPIYFVRMWLVERDMQKYAALEDKKKLIELRLLELRMEEQSGSSDSKLQKQIAYYEDRISDIEYKMSKLHQID